MGVKGNDLSLLQKVLRRLNRLILNPDVVLFIDTSHISIILSALNVRHTLYSYIATLTLVILLSIDYFA